MSEEKQESGGFHGHKAGVHEQSSQTQPCSHLLQSRPGQHLGRKPSGEDQWPPKPITRAEELGVGLDHSDAYGGWFGNMSGLVHTHKLLCINYTSLAKLYNLLKRGQLEGEQGEVLLPGELNPAGKGRE